MKPTTIRLPEELLEELDAEAEEHDFHTRTEYLRYLIDHRDLVVSIALEQRKTRIDQLTERVEELEERLETVETAAESEADQPVETESEEIEAVEEFDLGESEEAPGDGTPDGVDQPQTLGPIPEIEEGETEPLELRDPGPEDVGQRVRALDFFAPTREIRHEREAAVVAAWETLVEYRELTRADFRDLVFEEYPAAFSAFDGWYDRLLVPALEQFDDVEQADEETWRYVGSE